MSGHHKWSEIRHKRDHADTIRRAVEIPAGEDGWRAFLNAHDDEELREFSVVRREDALALLAERQQAIDALRAVDTYIKDLAFPGPEAQFVASLVGSALEKLGEKP